MAAAREQVLTKTRKISSVVILHFSLAYGHKWMAWRCSSVADPIYYIPGIMHDTGLSVLGSFSLFVWQKHCWHRRLSKEEARPQPSLGPLSTDTILPFLRLASDGLMVVASSGTGVGRGGGWEDGGWRMDVVMSHAPLSRCAGDEGQRFYYQFFSLEHEMGIIQLHQQRLVDYFTQNGRERIWTSGRGDAWRDDRSIYLMPKSEIGTCRDASGCS